MIDLKYSLIIDATEDSNFFCFYSPDLEGFTGIGRSIEDCLYNARRGIEEHIALLRERRLPVLAPVAKPTVMIQDTKPRQTVVS
jgi:predicted RNase H-like HicB family nuclease